MSLIVIVFVISILHSQISEVQPIQPHIALNQNADKSPVESQRAYSIPAVADNYVASDTLQKSPSQTTQPVSARVSNIAAKAPSPTTSQSTNVATIQKASASNEVHLVMNSMEHSSNFSD
jgi:hypothetical protein